MPLWLLGSSLYSAQLAAQLGLPFAFASHFAPDMLFRALQLYRENFKPSKQLAQPHAMVCVNVVAADSDSDARFLFSSMQQQFINLRRGSPGPLPPPVDNIHAQWTAGEQYGVEQALRMSIVGDEKRCATGCKRCCVKPMPTDHGQRPDLRSPARLRSFEIVAGVQGDVVKG